MGDSFTRQTINCRFFSDVTSSGLTNIEAHRFRLMLADGRILRLSGGDVPLRSLLPEAKEGEAPPVEAVDNGNGNEV